MLRAHFKWVPPDVLYHLFKTFCMPMRVLIPMYNAFALPHIDYCCTVFYPLSTCNITRLQRLQNRALGLILKAAPRSHIEDMLTGLNCMSIKHPSFQPSCFYLEKWQQSAATLFV